MPDGFSYLRSGAERAAEAEAAPESADAPAAEAAAEPEPQAQADDYPVDGTIAEVKAWIGDDLDRAQEALDHEEQRSNPRVTLLDYLHDMVGETTAG